MCYDYISVICFTYWRFGFLFQECHYEEACKKFVAALQVTGYKAETCYNIAVCFYMMKQYSASLKYINEIIEKGVQEYPGEDANFTIMMMLGCLWVLASNYEKLSPFYRIYWFQCTFCSCFFTICSFTRINSVMMNLPFLFFFHHVSKLQMVDKMYQDDTNP